MKRGASPGPWLTRVVATVILISIFSRVAPGRPRIFGFLVLSERTGLGSCRGLFLDLVFMYGGPVCLASTKEAVLGPSSIVISVLFDCFSRFSAN